MVFQTKQQLMTTVYSKSFFHISVLFLNVIKENKKTPSNKKLVWTDVSLLGYNKIKLQNNIFWKFMVFVGSIPKISSPKIFKQISNLLKYSNK